MKWQLGNTHLISRLSLNMRTYVSSFTKLIRVWESSFELNSYLFLSGLHDCSISHKHGSPVVSIEKNISLKDGNEGRLITGWAFWLYWEACIPDWASYFSSVSIHSYNIRSPGSSRKCNELKLQLEGRCLWDSFNIFFRWIQFTCRALKFWYNHVWLKHCTQNYKVEEKCENKF